MKWWHKLNRLKRLNGGIDKIWCGKKTCYGKVTMNIK
jgi:hypothetical protein